MLLALERNANGPRVRVVGQRVHHGAVGVALTANRRRFLRFCGLLLMVHDVRDWRSWFRGGWQS